MWAEPRTWVEVVGTVEPPATLLGPLTALPCVLYRVDLGLLQRLLESEGAAREVAGGRFRLRARSGGEVLVDPGLGEIRIPRQRAIRRRVRLGRDPGLDERLLALYRRLRRPPPRRATVVCRELSLQPGERVRVIGELVELAAPGGTLLGGYRQPPRERVVRAGLVQGL